MGQEIRRVAQVHWCLFMDKAIAKEKIMPLAYRFVQLVDGMDAAELAQVSYQFPPAYRMIKLCFSAREEPEYQI